MKKILLVLTVVSLVIFGAISCKKTGVPDVIPPSLFEIASPTFAGDYYIENIPSTEFKIPVGSTTVSNVDRNILFTYTSSTGAQNGVHYTAPTSIVIPAGKALDTLRIKGIFGAYPAGRKDKIKIQITGGDLPKFAGKDSFLLNLQKYCPVSLTDLSGSYANVIDNNSYGPYTMGAGSAISTGATSGTMVISNLWDYGAPTTVKIALDWADPANFKVTIADQEYYTPDDMWVKGTTVGSFSSCDQTLTLKYMLYEKTTGTVKYADQVTIMKR